MPARPDVTLRSRLRGRVTGAGVALTAVATLLTGACGGLSEPELPGPTAPTPPLSRVDYVTQANEICRATTREIAARTDEVGSPNLGTASGEERQQLAEAVEPVGRLAVSRLRNLTPPPDDEALVSPGIDAMEAVVDAIDTDPTGPLDPVGLNRPELFDYGLTGCFSTR